VPFLLQMLDQLATDAAVALLNRLLVREYWARDRLAPFAGRGARIEGGPFALQFGVRDGGTFETSSGVADVTISMDATALPQALLDPKAVMRNVRLVGDAEFAQALSYVLQNLRPEPEEELSRFIGDVAAQRSVGFLRAAFAQARDAGARLAATAADYFVAENPLVVARTEADSFARDVAALRDAVERLGKRIDSLKTPGSP
jgi:ubiquinone biosynthesis protein UbiJ